MINVMKILAYAAAKLRGVFKTNETRVAEREPADAEGVVVVYDRLTHSPAGKTDMSKASLIYAAANEDADEFDTGYGSAVSYSLAAVEFWRTASGNVVSRFTDIGGKKNTPSFVCQASDEDLRIFIRRVSSSRLKRIAVDTVSADVERAYVDSLKDI